MNTTNKRELKAIILPVIVTVLIFSGIFAIWFHTPLYNEFWQQNRDKTIQAIQLNDYHDFGWSPRQRTHLMEKYDISEDDLNGLIMGPTLPIGSTLPNALALRVSNMWVERIVIMAIATFTIYWATQWALEDRKGGKSTGVER